MMNNELIWKYFETILEIICFIIECIIIVLISIKFYTEKIVYMNILYFLALLVNVILLGLHGISLRNKLINYINKKWRKK